MWTPESKRAESNGLYLSPSVPSRIGERLPVGPASTPIPFVGDRRFGVSRSTTYRHPLTKTAR